MLHKWVDPAQPFGQSFAMDPSHLDRASMYERARSNEPFDVVVVGGGATGLGCALDAAARGYRTALFEAGDFACATSSASTKLIHGGVRYLRRGQIALVREAMHERALLARNAPGIVHERRFCIPVRRRGERAYYRMGLALYDALGGSRGFARSQSRNRRDTLDAMPGLLERRVRGGVFFSDGQFDDSRLAVSIARTAASFGAVLLNYARVVALARTGGRVDGVVTRDAETGAEWNVNARVVVNATGAFSDSVRRLDRPDTAPTIRASRGTHVVVPARFLPGDCAMLVPKTDDGRVVFAIPWHGRVLVGTTDTPVDRVDTSPAASEEDQAYLLKHLARYLESPPGPDDVLSRFAGIRPLVATRSSRSTARLSRTHRVRVSQSGLVTIAGGKWTTYRRMAQDTIDQAAFVGQLAQVPSITRTLPLIGAEPEGTTVRDGFPVGMDRGVTSAIAADRPDLENPVGEGPLPTGAEVVWAVRAEMARTVEDVLSRRSRALLLDARAARRAAGTVARIMARELGRDAAWAAAQTDRFTGDTARNLSTGGMVGGGARHQHGGGHSGHHGNGGRARHKYDGGDSDDHGNGGDAGRSI